MLQNVMVDDTQLVTLAYMPSCYSMQKWAIAVDKAVTIMQVSAIDTCFREPVGRQQCSQIQGTMEEGKSSGPFGSFFGS